MLRTRICDLLDIEVPVIAAPMGFISGAELAAAISNAGGLGVMSFSGNPPSLLREEIRRLRTLTDRPFGVNLLLDGPHLPFPIEDNVTVCLEERVPVLSFFWGDPTRFVEPAHAAGVKVMDQVGTVDAALRSARAGVDLIIAQGVEAGGHIPGEVTTMALVPRIVDAVAPVPGAAAGGIADGRGLVAALALGADAAAVGTRFLATHEAAAHEIYKQRVIEANETDTVRTILFGHGWPNAPHRALRTRFVEEWLGKEERAQESRSDEPVIGEITFAGQRIPVLRFMGFPPNTTSTGDIESMGMLAGQVVGLVRELKSAGEVVRELIEDAQRIIQERLARL